MNNITSSIVPEATRVGALNWVGAQFPSIKPGDLIRIATGPLAGNTAIALRITQTINTFSPLSGWYGGASLRIETDFGVVHHFNLDFENPVAVPGWLSEGEVKSFLAFK